MLMVMNWTKIPGLEDGYEACEDGLIRSTRPWGNRPCPRLVATHPLKAGYLTFHAFNEKGKYCTFMVHRIIAITFIPNPGNLRDVNHKNCDKTDNRVENLEWLSHYQNIRHGVKNGRIKFGENSPHAKLTNAQVREIRNRAIEGGETHAILAKEFGVSYALISMISNGYRSAATADGLPGLAGCLAVYKGNAVAKVALSLGLEPGSAERGIVSQGVQNPLVT